MRAALGSPCLSLKKFLPAKAGVIGIRLLATRKGAMADHPLFFTHALPEPEAFAVHGQDVGMMGQAVQQGPGQLLLGNRFILHEPEEHF